MYYWEPAKPMEIDEKIQQLITESDAVIIIFTKDKKIEGSEYYTTSSWLNSELSFAMGREKPFLRFYDNFIDPDEKKGIHGEFEYIDFNHDCLDDSLLKAIQYTKEFRMKILAKTMNR